MVRAVLVVILVLGGSHLLAYFQLQQAEENWEQYSTERSAAYLDEAAREFTDQQRQLRRYAVEIGSSEAVQEALHTGPGGREGLFAQAVRFSREHDIGVEVYDRSGELVAWSGRSGNAQRREIRLALDGQMSSRVTRTPIDAQLFVVTPVRSLHGILGAVLVRSRLEVDAPLARRFTSGPGMTERLEKRLGVPLSFDFSPGAELSKDGRYASAVLYGIDSARIGVINVMRPARSESLDQIASRFEGFDAGLLLVLAGILAFGLWRMLRARSSFWGRVLGATLLLWMLRYALLLLDIPSGFITGSLFDPMMFASKFGGGLAKSVGELLITAIVASVNVAVLARGLLGRAPGAAAPARPALRAALGGAPVAVVLLWSLRGYAAVVQSAVVDSSFEYLNLRSIYPSFPHVVMVVCLLLLGLALLVLSVVVVWGLARWAGVGKAARTDRTVWFVISLLFAAAAVLFGVLGNTPLTGLEYRLQFSAVVVLLAVNVGRSAAPGRLSSVYALAFLLIASLQLYPLLYQFTREHDRRRIELMAQDLLRPVDTWFSLVVQEGLRSFASEETQAVIARGDENEIGRLAYTRWVQNPACREGYTSIFTFFDSTGTVRSRFAIGGQAAAAMAVDTTLLMDNVREVTVREVGKGVNATKVYAGLTDISTPDGRLLGFGQVTVAAGQQTLFRGETPMILRAGVRRSLQSFYRPITFTEFRGGRALAQGGSSMPIGDALPQSVQDSLLRSPNGGFWVEEDPWGGGFETGFFRRPGTTDDVLAVSVQGGGAAGHVIGMVKLLICMACVGLVLFTLFGLPRWVHDRQIAMTFRGKLQAAMLITAVIPLVILTWYGALYNAERLLEESARTLEDETRTVASYIAEQEGSGPQGSIQLDRRTVEEIASEINTDFIVYEEGILKATSRPELFDLGILDRRLSGSAFASLVLQGQPFAVERERIGRVDYAVGYRPLPDSLGRAREVIAVPTLFRQERVEQESAQRNAVLFGVYAVVLVVVFILAALLANRIAAPIQQLTAATRRVAEGDLDVHVDVPSADGELRQLIDSFEAMTRDLKASRERLVMVERELAWKEMAKQVAHEIKNPLTPMKLSVQHLRQAFADRAANLDEILTTVTATIVEQIETLSRIASEFSHFARMPRRKLEPCKLDEVLRESTQLFEQEGSVVFSSRIEAGLPPVQADREELRRAFINLLRNGIQAMDGKGRIEITARREGAGVRITIRDEGKGIPEEFLAKLFQPNFSTKTDGMGLGLAIVKKTIDDLGGTVALLPAEGKGTVASIFLPLEEDAE